MRSHITNITLIGMPASGKSSLGRMLAQNLNYDFVNGDVLIESYGKTLPQILREMGDREFMRIEEEMLLGLAGEKKVFSPGGSSVYSEKGMRHMKEISFVVYLDVPFHLIQKRLHKKGTNRIAGQMDMTLKQLYDYRRPLYLKYADMTIRLGDVPKSDNFRTLMQRLEPFLDGSQEQV